MKLKLYVPFKTEKREKLQAETNTVSRRSVEYEHIQQSYNFTSVEWSLLFNRCLIEGTGPDQWRYSRINVLYKGKGDPRDPNNYRGIALQQTSFKCFTKIINNRIINHTIDKLPREHYGFIPGKSTTDAIKVLVNNISETLEKPRGKLYACFVDFSKAFDSVDRDRQVEKLAYNFNMGGKIFTTTKNILQPNNICVFDGSRLSKVILQEKGLLQGDSLSPTLFILYISDLPNSLKENAKNIKILLYADDLVFFIERKYKLVWTIWTCTPQPIN